MLLTIVRFRKILPAIRQQTSLVLIGGFSASILLLGTPSVMAQPAERAMKARNVQNIPLLRDIQSTELVFERLKETTSAPVITAVAGSPDGQLVAVAGDDHAIRIVSTESGETIQTALGHEDWIQSMLFAEMNHEQPEWRDEEDTDPLSQNAHTYLFSAGHDGRVLRWKFTLPLEAEEVAIVPYAVRSISVSSERQLLAIGGFSEEVLLYDLQQRMYVNRLKCTTKDQRCVRFSPDGTRLLSGSRDGVIMVWDTSTGELLARYHEHRGRIHTASFSADANAITSASEDRRIIRYDLLQHEVVWNHELAMSKLISLCLINDQLVAVAGADNGIRLFDAETNQVVAEMAGHQGTVAVMTACGESLVSGSFDTTVRIWNLAELEEMRVGRNIPASRTPIKMDARLQIR